MPACFQKRTFTSLVFLLDRVQDLHEKAALAVFHIIAYPPFRDGNKRMAQNLAEEILEHGGYCITPSDKGLSEVMQGVAEFTADQEDIERWLHSNTHAKEIS
jgi:death-on-curing family protein